MHEITIERKHIDGRFGPGRKYRPLNGSNGRFLLRVVDSRIVTADHDYLSDAELASLRMAWKRAGNGREFSEEDLDKKWAETAIEGELDKIVGLHGDKPHKPDSQYWACLCRIAGAVKGSGKQHIRPSEVLAQLLRFTPHDMKWKLASREKDITYLWGRAMNRAPARYRNDANN